MASWVMATVLAVRSPASATWTKMASLNLRWARRGTMMAARIVGRPGSCLWITTARSGQKQKYPAEIISTEIFPTVTSSAAQSPTIRDLDDDGMKDIALGASLDNDQGTDGVQSGCSSGSLLKQILIVF